MIGASLDQSLEALGPSDCYRCTPVGGAGKSSSRLVRDIGKAATTVGGRNKRSVKLRPMIDRCSRRTGRSTATLYDKRTGAPAPAVAKLVFRIRDMKRAAVQAVPAADMEQMFTSKSAGDCGPGSAIHAAGRLSTAACPFG